MALVFVVEVEVTRQTAVVTRMMQLGGSGAGRALALQ